MHGGVSVTELRDIDKISKRLLAQQDAIVKALQPLNPYYVTIARQMSSFQPLLAVAKTYLDSISPIVEQFQKIDWEGFEEFEKDFGWLEAISFAYAFKLKEVLKSQGKEAVWTKLISDLNDEGFLNELRNDGNNTALIKRRSHIISRALDHHMNKDFISSIPLLLSQVEGIIWDLGVYKKMVDDKPNSKCKIDNNGTCILDSKGRKLEWGLGELLRHLFGDSSRFANHAGESVYSKELRHPVLHGRQTDYDDAQNSTLLILLLQMIIEKVKNETLS